MRTRRLGCTFTFLLALLLAGAAYLFHSSILTALGGYLIRADPLERADAVVSLAAGYSYHRDIAAADLVLAGHAPLLILTRPAEPQGLELLRDRGVQVEPEIERRLRYLSALGVSSDAVVVLPTLVRSTADEAYATADWVRRVRPSAARLIVVTSSYHTRRAHFIFSAALEGLGVEILTRPATTGEFQASSWWKDRDSARDGFIEWQKLLFYRVRY